MKFLNVRMLLHASIALIAWTNSPAQCGAQGFVLQMGQFDRLQKHTLTLMPRSCSAVRMEFTSDGDAAIQIQENAIWWDANTTEGVKHLNHLLSQRADRRVEELTKQKQFTPEQVTKLKIAAGIQVARDCRAIRKLVSLFVTAVFDDPMVDVSQLFRDETGLNLMRKSAEVGELIDAGVDRKDSFFTKVLRKLE